MQPGNYGTNILILLEDDTELTVTEVCFHQGFKQTQTEPSESAIVEVIKVENEEGVEIDFEQMLTQEHYDEIEKEFYDERRQSRF